MAKGNKKYIIYGFILFISIIFGVVNWLGSFYCHKKRITNGVNLQTVILAKQTDLSLSLKDETASTPKNRTKTTTLDEKKYVIEYFNPFSSPKAIAITKNTQNVNSLPKTKIACLVNKSKKDLKGEKENMSKSVPKVTTTEGTVNSESALIKNVNEGMLSTDTESNAMLPVNQVEQPIVPQIKLKGIIRSNVPGMTTKFLLEDENGSFTAVAGDSIEGYTINTSGENLVVLENENNSVYFSIWNLDNNFESGGTDIFHKVKLVGIFTDKSEEGEKTAICKIENDDVFLSVGDIVGQYIVYQIGDGLVGFWDGEKEKKLYF